MKMERIRKENTAFLVIDIQEKLFPIIHEKEALIKNTQILLELCTSFDIPIVATEQYAKGLGHTVEEIGAYIPEGEVYEKMTFSAFTQIEEVLKKKAIKTVIVSGIETHICVYQTVRDLINAGYEVIVPVDVVSSRTLQNKEVGLNLMKEMGACITSCETVVFDVLEQSGGEIFKKMSKLVK